jgi:microcystin-dependent protein
MSESTDQQLSPAAEQALKRYLLKWIAGVGSAAFAIVSVGGITGLVMIYNSASTAARSKAEEIAKKQADESIRVEIDNRMPSIRRNLDQLNEHSDKALNTAILAEVNVGTAQNKVQLYVESFDAEIVRFRKRLEQANNETESVRQTAETLKTRLESVEKLDALKAKAEDVAEAMRKLIEPGLKQTFEKELRSVPPGTIMAYAGTIDQSPATRLLNQRAGLPQGWVLCDGSKIDTRLPDHKVFEALQTAIGGSWGSAEDSLEETFLLPDLRGMFLRGVDGSANRDSDRESRHAFASGGNKGNKVGSFQDDQFKSHTHGIVDPGHSHSITPMGKEGHLYAPGNQRTAWAWDPLNAPRTHNTETSPTGISISQSGGSESRPKNAYVNWIIKY